ncbi:hypothetical protein B0H63DRAFT_517191 [Podospora didyma]|uniref:RING-type domain-containing protein n=1 Tax=Podospora didyma TaxID=330526 RepID=A0AAE0U7M4_9PEZI|nr:hypothetical protein B0H63DRAFT_517191 [Podospora didyma]
MDEMDYEMHNADSSASQTQHQHHQQQHHQQQPSRGGCPYFRADLDRQAYPSSLPNPHLYQQQHHHHQQFQHQFQHQHPHPHSGHPSHHHQQQQQQQPQQQQQQPPPPPGLMSSPNRGPSHSNPHPHPHHYDPVHSVNNSWYSTGNAPFQWPVPMSLPSQPQVPHPRSSEAAYFGGIGVGGPGGGGAPGSVNNAPGSGSTANPVNNSSNAGGGAAGTSGAVAGAAPGPMQPGLVQSHSHYQLAHDPFVPPFSFAFRHPASLHRFPPPVSIPSMTPQQQSPGHHHNHHQTQTQTQTQTHHQNLTSHQTQNHQQQPHPHHPPPQLSLHPQSASRGTISVPALNPPSAPPQSQAPSNMSSSGESSPVAPAAPPVVLSRPFASSSSEDVSRGLNRSGNTSSSTSASASVSSSTSTSTTTTSAAGAVPQIPIRPSLFNMESTRPEPGASSSAPPPAPMSNAEASLGLGAPPPADRRRFNARAARILRASAQHIDFNSDDEDPELDDDEQTFRFIEQFSVQNPYHHNDHVRQAQLIRGQLSSGKRIASKKALGQLQSVDMSTLEESEKTCVICYNEFGVPNPEGINEAPLRLPKCKHIFGDHCIKKWFEESDSCPYCRDKVPSEPIFHSQTSHQAIRDFIRSSQYLQGPRYTAAGGSSRPPADARTLPTGETLVRIMAAQRDEGVDSSPPRNFQTGERRSPPSEAADSRRRTRPRHGSFLRGSPSSSGSATTGAPSRPNSHAGTVPAPPSQQSPPRERVNAPNPPPHWSSFSYNPHRSLTQLSARQFTQSTNRPGPSYRVSAGGPPFLPFEGMGMGPPSMSGQLMLGFAPLMNPAEGQQPFPSPLNGGVGGSSGDHGQLPHMPPFPQQLPPVLAMDGFPLDGPVYQGSSTITNDSSSSTREAWTQ